MPKRALKPDPEASHHFDVEAFAANMARMLEESGKAMAAYLRPREKGRVDPGVSENLVDMVKTLATLADYWMRDPARTLAAQTNLMQDFAQLWSYALKRFTGEPAEPVAVPDSRDRRFSDPGWQTNGFYDLLKQAYLIAAQWSAMLVEDAEELDPHVKQKARFYMRQLAGALSPSNFIATNPELLRETLAENGANLVRGLHMLAEDIETGQGELKIRQSDLSQFKVGVNLAVTPGKVVFRNKVMELIQYAPATAKVMKRPVLIVPPWINKYYVLDLNPEKSFIKWCVDQGLTLFVISWINPDESLRFYGFAEYMREGPLAALDQIAKITGERTVSAIGYCIGGTLLAMTLAVMAARRDTRISSATFLTAQVDFERAGDLKVFIDEEQIAAVEREMERFGYLPGLKMANSFNLLRSGDLVWPYIVNNYVRGKAPAAFDLLYWNADTTRLPAKGHSFYLRDCYLHNKLSKGEVEIEGVKVNLRTVTVPIYSLATKEDHIAPARSVYQGALKFGGSVRYVVAGSGHIAGVVNPPHRNKYQYWTGAKPKGRFETWMEKAVEHPGSWWPDWLDWVAKQAPATVPAAKRKPGGRRKTLCDAPGTYVKMQA